MELNGISAGQIKEAAWVVQSVAGASAYMHGVDYDVPKFKDELDEVVAHIRQAHEGG